MGEHARDTGTPIPEHISARPENLPELIQGIIKQTHDHNVHVVNDTIDCYRYFDASPHAEFLYSCVQKTIEHGLPEEAAFLQRYDRFKSEAEEIGVPTAPVRSNQ